MGSRVWVQLEACVKLVAVDLGLTGGFQQMPKLNVNICTLMIPLVLKTVTGSILMGVLS